MTRRRRIAHIRKTVVALSLAIFIALFSGLYVQMAAGRDPVLGSQKAATSSSSASSGSTSSDSTATTNTDTTAGSSTTAAVTTSQS